MKMTHLKDLFTLNISVAECLFWGPISIIWTENLKFYLAHFELPKIGHKSF